MCGKNEHKNNIGFDEFLEDYSVSEKFIRD